MDKLPPIKIQSVPKPGNHVEVGRDLEILSRSQNLVIHIVNQLVDSNNGNNAGPPSVSGASGSFGPLSFYTVQDGLVKSAQNMTADDNATIRFDGDNWVASNYLENHGTAALGGVAVGSSTSHELDTVFQIVSDNTGVQLATIYNTSDRGSIALIGNDGANPPSLQGAVMGLRRDSFASTDDRLGLVSFGTQIAPNVNDPANLYNAAGIEGFAAEDHSSTRNGSYLVFRTAPTGTGYTNPQAERMRILADGTVGINQTVSLGQLHVKQNAVGTVVQYLEGISSQTANFITAVTNTPTTKFVVTKDGQIGANQGTVLGMVHSKAAATTSIGVYIETIASQTGSYLTAVDSSGNIRTELNLGAIFAARSDGNGSAVRLETYSGGSVAPSAGAGFSANCSRGTQSSPTAIQSGDTLGFVGFGGYDGGSIVQNQVLLVGQAAENWTSGANRGSHFSIQTKPTAGGTRAERFRITANGSVYAGVGAIATTATAGHFRIPTCAGVPTGVPEGGSGSMVFDTTNNRLYIYDGGWIMVALA